MEVVFEPGDEVRWVSAIQIVGEEADLDVGIGDGDPDLVLEGRDALGTDSEPAESADLSGGSAGLGRGLVELLLEEALEVLARVHSLRSEEHTSELQSLMRISYAVFCL